MKKPEIDPAHPQKRSALRFIGLLVLAAGVGLLAVALVSFFGAMSGHGEPRLFWCAFVGMPLIFVGTVLCFAGFAGSVQRYLAGETAPVAKDTFNYLADGTQEGVKTVAAAVGAGVATGIASANSAESRCYKCNATNDATAKFCRQCGAVLLKSRPCPACNELNDPDARFCDACGRALSPSP